MSKLIQMLKIDPESFGANVYTVDPFRVIGLIDAKVEFTYGIEKVTLAYYRSSGTNNGKIKGLWYPIVGIKTHDDKFTEFTEYINFVLTVSTRARGARRGWLAKSLFFMHQPIDDKKIRGFSGGRHYGFLLETGKQLRDLYDNKNFFYMKSLNAERLNSIVISKEVYQGNSHSQRENYERFIQAIFSEDS